MSLVYIPKDEERKSEREEKKANSLVTEEDYKKEIEKLGEEEGFDLLNDYNTIKRNMFQQSYSPRTNKVYSYDEGHNLTYEQYYKDLKEIGHGETPYKDFMNTLADAEMSTIVGLAPGLITKAYAQLPERIIEQAGWGEAEMLGGSFAYKYGKGALDALNTVNKAIAGDEEAKKEIQSVSNESSLGGALTGSNKLYNFYKQKSEQAINEKMTNLNAVQGGSGTEFARGFGNVAGNILLTFATAGFGEIAGPALGTTAKAGSTASIIGGSALSSGLRTATYTDDPTEIVGNAVQSGVQSAVTIGTLNGLSSKLPVFSNTGANIAKNIGIGATAGYLSQTAGKGVEDVKKLVKGEGLTKEDIVGTFASPEHAISAGVTGLGYGLQGTLNDKKVLNQKNPSLKANKVTKEEAYKVLGLKSNATEEEIISASRKLVKSYHTDTGGAGANTEKLNEVLKARDYLLENIEPNTSLFAKIKNAFSEFANKVRTPDTKPTETQVTNPYLPASVSNAPAVNPVTANTTNIVGGITAPVATKNPNAPTTDLTTAKISPERLDAYLKEWTNSKMPNYSQAYLTRMTPDEFLSLTATDSDMEHIKNDNARRAEHGWTLDKVKYDPEETTEPQAIKLTVDFDTGEVIGHEGRHRMQALKDNGIKNVDVVIKPYAYSESFDRSNPQKYIDKIAVTQQYGVKPATVLLKDLDVISPSNLDYIKEKYLNSKNENGTIRYSQNSGYKRIYIIKPMSKETNPNWDKNIVVYDDKDNEFKLSDYKDVIENSMSMKEAEEMIKRAYILEKESPSSYRQTHGYNNLKKFINEKPEQSIAFTILHHGDLVDKYINPIEEFKKNPYLIEGVVRAYKNRALKGKLPTRNKPKVDTTKDYGALKNADKRNFYETGYSQKEEKNTSKESKLFTAIKEKPNGFNNSEIKKARREFVIKAHDKNWLKDNKISLKQANEYIEEWTSKKKPSMELSNKLNQGVAPENRWIGIENSTVLSNGTFDEHDIRNLGIKLSGRKNENLEAYIINTILAIDTHETWFGLEVDCETGLFDGDTGAEYDHIDDRIEVYQNAQNNVSHEMGHRLDHHWANTIFGRLHHGTTNYGFLTQRVTDDCLDKLLFTEDERNFVKHFYDFLDDIGHNTTFKNSYTIDDTETFARFVSKFVDWTFKKAGNNIGETDNDWYRDTFTEKQFKEFVKILQEKSALDQKLAVEEQTKEFKDFQSVQRSVEDFATSYHGDAYLGTFKELVLDSFNDGKSSKEDFLKRIFENKEKYIEDDKKYAGENREYLINSRRDFFSKINKSVYMEHALGMIYDRLKENLEESNAGKSVRIGKSQIGNSLKMYFNYDSFLRPRNVIRTLYNKDPNKNLTVEKQNKDLERANKANEQLRNKLAKEKEKSKEKTKKKNQEKKEAVKKQREKDDKKIKALNKKYKEQLQDVRLRAKATTTDKKMKLAQNKLEKSLKGVYDKPMSPELEKALETLQKNTRGSIKLIDNVKNKLPSSYSHFADDVKEIVNTIYTGGNTMTDEKRASLEKKAEAIRKFIKEHPGYPVSQRALDLLKEPTKKNISDLNPVDLVDMAEDVAEIGIAIRDMFSFVRASEDAMKLREDAINFAKERRATGKTRSSDNLPDNKVLYKGLELSRRELDKRSTLKTLILRLAGGNPNSPLKFISDELTRAYNDYNVNTEKMLEIFDKFVKIKKLGNVRVINNVLNDIFNHKKEINTTLKTTTGKEYRPSIADAVSLVLGVRDPQFAGHTVGVLTDTLDKEGKPVMSSGGIARFSSRIDQKYGEQNKGLKRGVSVKLTMKDIEKISAELEEMPYVKELMDAFKELSDTTFVLTNEEYEAINGMSLEKRDYYFPVSNDPATRVRQKAVDKIKEFSGLDASTTLLNVSIVKPVVVGANNQILIYPIDEVIRKMISDTATYSAYATALYDINTFLSGVAENGQTLVELINDIDPSFLTNYNDITNALIGNVKHPNASKVASRYTSAILKGNIWIAMKQAGSYFTTAKYFDHPFRSLLAGAFAKKNIANKIRDLYKEQGIDLSKLNTDQVLRYFWSENVDAEIATRARGWNTATRDQLLKHLGILQHINTLDFYKGVDYSTVRAIAYAMIYDTILSGKFDGSKEHFAELHNRFLTANIETQPNTSAVTRTPLQSSSKPLDRALAYMGDPRLKTLNMLMDARLEHKYYRKNGTKEEKQKDRRNYARAIAGALGSLAFLTSIARFKKKIEGKDDEKGFKGFLKDMLGNAISLTVGLEQITGKFMDDYSFDVELPDTQALNILLKSYDDMKKFIAALQKDQSNKVEKAVSDVIGDISKFMGVPYQNLKTAYEDLLGLTGSELYWENKIKSDNNAYNKFKKYEDKITDYENFYKIYKATREKAVKDTYGKYNESTVKKAIKANGGTTKEWYSIMKEGS